MNQPPSHMTIELGEKDVREDLPKIIKDMTKIRVETIKDRNLSNEQKDEYLHMTYRLASGIKAVADESMTKKMQIVADRLTKNSCLVKYDSMQDAYWRKKEAKFSNTLDDLLITIVRDDFNNLDAKHHVLQAIKYLGVADTAFNEREKIYDTILPFQSSVQLPSPGLFKKFLGALVGETYKVEDSNDLNLKVLNKPQEIESLLKEASDLGYQEVQMVMGKNEFEEMSKTYPNIKLINEINPEAKFKGLRKLTANVIKYSCPVSIPLLGALPRYTRKSIEDYVKPDLNWLQNKKSADNMEEAEGWSTMIIQIAGGIISFIAGTKLSNNHLMVGGIYCFGEGVGRLIYTFKKNRIPGVVPVTLLLSPLERMLGKKRGKGNLVEAGIALENKKKNPVYNIPNPVDYYDKIARLEIPEDVEKNLVWDTDNHHSFGKVFIDYMKENTGAPNSEIEIKTLIDKESQTVSYNHELSVDGFRKNSSLFCFNEGRRYLVTAIAKNNGKYDFANNTANILSNNSDISETLGRLGKRFDAKYIHLKEYQNNQIINDLEGFG